MPGTFDRDPGVVVEVNVVRAPEDGDRQWGTQANTQRGHQALWPGVRMPQRRARPVERLHERSDRATGGKHRLWKPGAHRASWGVSSSVIVTDCHGGGS